MIQYGDAMTDASPLPDQNGASTCSPFRKAPESVLCWSFSNLIEQSFRGFFQAAEALLLKPVSDGSDHQGPYGDLGSITDPVSNTTQLFHDGAGRVISILDALHNLTQVTYDKLDRVTKITDANAGTTQLAYDADGDLTSLTDANNNITTYPTYDSRDRLTKRTDALSKSDTYVYDANSNLTQDTDRIGNVIAYTYDLRTVPLRRATAFQGSMALRFRAQSLSPGTAAAG
jgi:YD repeat-containing protein